MCFDYWISLGIWRPSETPEWFYARVCMIFLFLGIFTNRFFWGAYPSTNVFFPLEIYWVICIWVFYWFIEDSEPVEFKYLFLGIDLWFVMFFLLFMCDELIFFTSFGCDETFICLLLIICPVFELALLYIG